MSSRTREINILRLGAILLAMMVVTLIGTATLSMARDMISEIQAEIDAAQDAPSLVDRFATGSASGL